MACLNDLMKLPEDHEILVLNNNSPDDTHEKLKNYIQLPCKHYYCLECLLYYNNKKSDQKCAYCFKSYEWNLCQSFFIN